MALDSRIVIHANAKVIEMIERAKFLSDRLIDQLPGIFAVVTESGAILRSNIWLAGLLGVPEDQARNHCLSELLPPESVPLFSLVLAEVAGGQKSHAQIELRLASSGQVYRFSVSRYGDALGTPLITVLGTDVTELRQSPGPV